MERVGKGFLKLLFGKSWVHFFGKEVLRKMCEKSNAERKSRKGLIT
jgi:hypothetical protein